MAVVRRLALVADNAIVEGDLRRARAALNELQAAALLVPAVDTRCRLGERHG
jgi:hypothetical protein